MKAQFSANVFTSFYLWLENVIQNDGQAYINNTSRLYYTQDDRVESRGQVAYAAPFKQWVYDSDVKGANIINSISGADIGIWTRGHSGLMFDFAEGRVLLDASVGTNLNITGSYAFKEINQYQTNQTLEELVIQDQFYLNPRFNGTPSSGVQPYVQVTPAIFAMDSIYKKEPFALGGYDMMKYQYAAAIMVETSYQMINVLGLLSDTEDSYLPLIPVEADPINEYGDLKTGYFNFNDIRLQYGTPGNLLHVVSARGSKFSDKIKGSKNLYYGYMDFEINYPRHAIAGKNPMGDKGIYL